MKQNIIILFVIITQILFTSLNSMGASKKKLQEITFNEMDVQGSARTPDGAYLVQRRGLRFLPLYEVKKDLDLKIRQSINYMR